MKTLQSIFLALTLLISTVAIGQNGYEVGDVVKDFKLKDVTTGEMVSLSDYSDQNGVIISFTCNHCPYAKAYEDRIIDLDREFDGKGYPLIAINPNDPSRVPEDSPENMKKRAEEKNYPFPYLFDATQEIARRFGAKKTPHMYILTKSSAGNFVVRYIGTIDDSPMNPDGVNERYVENAIAAIINGEEPDPSKTYAVGCTIKWKQ